MTTYSKTNHVITDATYITTSLEGRPPTMAKGIQRLVYGILDDINHALRRTTPALHFHGDSSIATQSR